MMEGENQEQLQQEPLEEFYTEFEKLAINKEEEQLGDQQSKSKINKVEVNEEFISSLIKCLQEIFPYHDLSSCNKVKTVELDTNCVEYDEVNELFESTNYSYKADKIERVHNIYLMGAYLLKKEQYIERYGEVPKEKRMFHGTDSGNVEAICNNNFNWRKCERGRYGKGVSFSPSSFYASFYPEEDSNSAKIMFVTNVIYNTTCIGNEEMILPEQGHDTSIKEDEKVYVKYEDNEFYPIYIIHYTLK